MTLGWSSFRHVHIIHLVETWFGPCMKRAASCRDSKTTLGPINSQKPWVARVGVEGSELHALPKPTTLANKSIGAPLSTGSFVDCLGCYCIVSISRNKILNTSPLKMKRSQSRNNYQSHHPTASRPSTSLPTTEFDWSIWDNPFGEPTTTTSCSTPPPHSFDNPFLDDASWSSTRTIRFADEEGQPLERICLVPSRQHADSQYLTGC